MSTQNILNNIPIQPAQSNVPVQYVSNCAPLPPVQTNPNPQCNQVQPCQNYIPRYSPYIQNGQVYSNPVPTQAQPIQQGPKPGGVSAVNITINGVNQPGQAPVAPPPQYYPNYVPYYVPQPPVTLPAQEIKKEPLAASKIENKPEEKKPEEKKPEEKKIEEKNNKKPVIELTDTYIKQLEQNLNDNSKDVRNHAVAELVKRFKEDESRKNDPRLTNLLNLALQDESKPVVYGAMQAIENGYASGNKVTEQRLLEIINKHDTFGNSETAEGLLTKMSGTKIDIKSPNASTPIKNEEQP